MINLYFVCTTADSGFKDCGNWPRIRGVLELTRPGWGQLTGHISSR